MKRALPVIYCTKCEEKIIITSEDRERLFTTCSKCNDITTFSNDMIKYHLVERNPTEIPPYMVSEINGRELAIRWKWNNPHGYIIFGAGFIPLFVSLCLYFYMKDTSIYFFFIIVLLFAGILSFLFMYSGMAQLFNRTIIKVNDDFITVNTEPFLTSYPVKIKVSEVDQFFCYEEKNYNVTGNSKKHYTLKVLLKNGRVQPLYNTFDLSPQRALFIEEEIETFLDIKDLPVTTGYKL